MNANMHAVEAFLSAYFATGRPSFLRRAHSICARLISFAAAAQWRVPEHFTADWTPLPGYHADRPADGFRPFGATPGHGVEWARLLLQLRLIPGGDPDGLLAAATALFGRAVADGWDAGRWASPTRWTGRAPRCRRSGCTGRCVRRSARPVIWTRRPGSPIRRLVRHLLGGRRALLRRPPGRELVARAGPGRPAGQHHLGRQARPVPRAQRTAVRLAAARADHRGQLGPAPVGGRRARGLPARRNQFGQFVQGGGAQPGDDCSGTER